MPSHPTFLNIPFNIILPSTSSSSTWSSSLRFPHQNPACNSPLPHSCYMLRHSHSSWLNTRIIYCERYTSLRSSLFSLIHSPVNLSLFLLSALLSDTLSLRSTFDMSDQVSYAYKTTGKITVQFLVTKRTEHENYQSLYLHFSFNIYSRTIKYKT